MPGSDWGCAVTAPLVAALFVDPKGPYWADRRCDCWDEARDARNYRGPLPVVAHPPCERWSKLAASVEARYPGRFPVGVDGGCFASALQSVLRWGGVLEHPAESLAWDEYCLPTPRFGRWFGFLRNTQARPRQVRMLLYVTEIKQVDYGHLAQKRTWLLYVGMCPPPPLRWEGLPHAKVVGFCSNRCKRPNSERLASSAASRTPSLLADCLIDLAANCGGAA
jgi:hypothetical protein